jgi:hypothetical protein
VRPQRCPRRAGAHHSALPFVDGGVPEGALSSCSGRFRHSASSLTASSSGVTGWVIWLHPEPSQPFEELTAAVWERWPDYPPYKGEFENVIPYLMISRMPIAVEVGLPISSHAHEVTLVEEGTDGHWTVRATFPLAALA